MGYADCQHLMILVENHKGLSPNVASPKGASKMASHTLALKGVCDNADHIILCPDCSLWQIIVYGFAPCILLYSLLKHDIVEY